MKLSPSDYALIVDEEPPSGSGSDAGSEFDTETEVSESDEGSEEESSKGPSDDSSEEGEQDSGEPEELSEAAPDHSLDPDEVFGPGMADEVPEITLEQNDTIKAAISEGTEDISISPHASLDVRPYAPHPAARARDHVVNYEFDSALCQAKVETYRNKVGATSRIIAGQLRRVLASRTVGTIERDRRAGKLDRRKLHTLNRPGRQPNGRVFQRKIEGQKLNTAVGLLVDQSGSMSGRKIACAREATVALADALSGLSLLGVQFGVWGFDVVQGSVPLGEFPYGSVDRTEPLRFHHYKGFSERWDRVSGRLGHMRAIENNCDGEAVRWAGHQLLSADVDRRILIVLSDGSPYCGTASDLDRIHSDLKRAIRDLGDRDVEVIGIGIMDMSVTKFYKNNVVIRSASELEGTLMSTLRKALLGAKVAA